jgi:hypothetical protein
MSDTESNFTARDVTEEEQRLQVQQAERFTDVRLGALQRVYCSRLCDSVLSAVLLLPASAAVAVIISWLLRAQLHFPRSVDGGCAGGCARVARYGGMCTQPRSTLTCDWARTLSHSATCARRMPPRKALEREAAYASLFVKPSLRRVTCAGAAATCLWALCQGGLLLATAGHEKAVTFKQPLEVVIVGTQVNLERRPAYLEEGALQFKTPCRTVSWTTEQENVLTTLFFDRMLVIAPLTANEKDMWTTVAAGFEPGTVSLIVYTVTGMEMLVVVANGEVQVGAYYTQAAIKSVRGAGLLKEVQDVAPFVPFFNDVLNQTFACTPLAAKCNLGHGFGVGVTTAVYQCPELQGELAASRAFASASDVMLDHVDVRVADGGGGFAASFADSNVQWGTSVEVGTVFVPRLNVLGAAIVGVCGALLYQVLSHLPRFDCTEAVLESYESMLQQYDQDLGKMAHVVEKAAMAGGDGKGAATQAVERWRWALVGADSMQAAPGHDSERVLAQANSKGVLMGAVSECAILDADSSGASLGADSNHVMLCADCEGAAVEADIVCALVAKAGGQCADAEGDGMQVISGNGSMGAATQTVERWRGAFAGADSMHAAPVEMAEVRVRMSDVHK